MKRVPKKPAGAWQCRECHRLNQPGERRCGAWVNTGLHPRGFGSLSLKIKMVRCAGERPRKR